FWCDASHTAGAAPLQGPKGPSSLEAFRPQQWSRFEVSRTQLWSAPAARDPGATTGKLSWPKELSPKQMISVLDLRAQVCARPPSTSAVPKLFPKGCTFVGVSRLRWLLSICADSLPPQQRTVLVLSTLGPATTAQVRWKPPVSSRPAAMLVSCRLTVVAES